MTIKPSFSPVTIQIVVLATSCIKKIFIPETYEAFVGCAVTKNWNKKIPFTWWAQIFAALMVIAPVMWIPVFIIWKKNAEVRPIPYLQGMIDQGMTVEEVPFCLRDEVQKLMKQLGLTRSRATNRNGQSYVVENHGVTDPKSSQSKV